MSPFAFEPTLPIANPDVQFARPAAPRPGGPGSFDDHLQQAAQAGSNSAPDNPQSPADPSTSQNSNAAPNSPAPADGGTARAKHPTSIHAASGKHDKSQTHSSDKITATPADKDGTKADTSTTTADSATAAPATDPKPAPAKTDAAATTTDVKPDADKTQNTDSAKPDSANGSQPSAETQTNAAPPTPAPAPQVVQAAVQTAAPVIPKTVVDALPKAAPSKPTGKGSATHTKGAPIAGNKNAHSAEGAKSHGSGEAIQTQLSPVAPADNPGDQATTPSEATAPSQPAAGQPHAGQISESTEVVPAGVTQQIIQAASTTSFVTTVQTAAAPVDLNQSAIGTSSPAAGPAPVAGATSNLVAPPNLNQTVQQSTTGSQSATATSGSGGSGGVENARFVQRVARAFQTAGDQGGTLRLRLSPPELGSVKLNITVAGGVLNARVEAETSQARDMLLANLPALRERLAEHNIQINEFDVDLFDGSAGGSSDQPRGNSDPQQAYVPAVARNNVKTASTAGHGAAAATTPSLVPQAAPGGLNVLI